MNSINLKKSKILSYPQLQTGEVHCESAIFVDKKESYYFTRMMNSYRRLYKLSLSLLLGLNTETLPYYIREDLIQIIGIISPNPYTKIIVCESLIELNGLQNFYLFFDQELNNFKQKSIDEGLRLIKKNLNS